MAYISTRGKQTDKAVSFRKILLEGLASNGGLYVPMPYQFISSRQLRSWRELSYADLALQVLAPYMDDIPRRDLHDILKITYTEARLINPIISL